MERKLILGALAGDIIGSVFEKANIKTTAFELFCDRSRFTDDTVMTVATMDAMLSGEDHAAAYQRYGRKYPYRGYGGKFREWIYSPKPRPYQSIGNGSAMRSSPIGWACRDMEEVMAEAKRSAEVSHDHPEGIKGAQAIATAVFMARNGYVKEAIREHVSTTFGYDMDRTIAGIRRTYAFDGSCPGSVPESIIAFLEGDDPEHAIRLAVSIGGDSDTIASMTGAMAEAFYGELPGSMVQATLRLLPAEFVDVVERFSVRYRG